jgi:hypothetical protein
MGSCIFSYYISESDIEIEELEHKFNFGKYIMLTDSRTPSMHSYNDNSECIIFGYAVNVFTRESDSLADKIISCCSNISEVIKFERLLGGKYLIFYRQKEEYFLIGDATCSIPVFFNVEESFSCTSNLYYLVNQYKYTPDQEFQSIRDSGDIAQAMPFDITQYSEIKQLLPNHYLSVNEREANRFINSVRDQLVLTIDEVTELATPLIEVMCEFYVRKFEIYCPITAGRDSRVVLAFLANIDEDIHCYTIKHPEHKENDQDIVVPWLLCLKNHFPYKQIHDITVSKELRKKMDYLLGENHYSPRTLQIAQTIYEHCGNGAIINGDIIGQVGKCSLHRDIPICFATPSYFRCKLHNYSSETKNQLGLWMEEIKNSGECVNVFDLFSIEMRMGRWAAQESLIYNSIGQVYLNIFNSRSIIYLWTSISRKERKKSYIHVSLIKRKMPELLDIPFESDKSIVFRLSKANWLTYLLSSYAKYYIERVKFKRGKLYEKIDNNS